MSKTKKMLLFINKQDQGEYRPLITLHEQEKNLYLTYKGETGIAWALLSCTKTPFQSEAKCKAVDMKMILYSSF